ncbi:hypothetical protein L6164_000115 [Bauhinia variegata]|uniref:Uncharacterized protein n=1 Tax=Bauhinia variegata TaxID=167791 RepID=A0ACB9Q5G2_BAUVA|nr:hypothetical protein L6164_000115 [Bauhinia variegata]
MANSYYASGGCSNLPKEMIVKRKGKIQKFTEEQGWSNLPDELLDIISRKIDFVSFFALSGVCKNWRRFYGNYWGEFMASQAEPLLILKSPLLAKEECSFFSISESKGYKLLLPIHKGEMESSDEFWKPFLWFSSGYVIMQSTLKIWLINPFSRKEFHIPTESPCQVLYTQSNLVPSFDHAFLSFVVNSEDFLVLGLSNMYSSNVFIYQSRSSNWVSYSIGENQSRITDVAVFHQTVYAVTTKGTIGKLRLSFPNFKVLELKNIPKNYLCDPKLVSTNEELLVIDFILNKSLIIYRIDLSKKKWVRVHSLGDRALFVGKFMKGYALSNPSKWGYESNCVYYISHLHSECCLYSMDCGPMRTVRCLYSVDGPTRTVHYYGNAATSGHTHYPMAWCFPTIRDEIDYSLHI